MQATKKAVGLNLTNLELQVADAESVDFEEETFDIITCSSAMLYLQHHERALRRFLSWLKAGGKLLFNTPQVKSFL